MAHTQCRALAGIRRIGDCAQYEEDRICVDNFKIGRKGSDNLVHVANKLNEKR